MRHPGTDICSKSPPIACDPIFHLFMSTVRAEVARDRNGKFLERLLHVELEHGHKGKIMRAGPQERRCVKCGNGVMELYDR